jgi:hypothetical protein
MLQRVDTCPIICIDLKLICRYICRVTTIMNGFRRHDTFSLEPEVLSEGRILCIRISSEQSQLTHPVPVLIIWTYLNPVINQLRPS